MHSEHGFFAKLVYQIKQRQQNRTNPERLRVNVIIKDAVSLETARDIIQRFSIAIEAYEKLQMELNDYLEQKSTTKHTHSLSIQSYGVINRQRSMI